VSNNVGPYSVGEQLVWVHVNDETNKRVNEMVTVMNVKVMNKGKGRPHYIVKTVTGDAGNAWHDELFRFEQ